tara:strand:- start:1058 stop:2215 length:1158 start_codon:yes stop_codon:yes gene_type:complete
MNKIDFNNLLDNYDTNLLDNLRGFGNEEEFLKFYVPGTSLITSFYNLIDALIEAQQLEFIISYKKESFDKFFYEKVNFFLKKISIHEEKTDNEFYNLKIKIDSNLYENFQKEKRYKIEEINPIKIDSKNKVSVFKSEKKINQPYLDVLHRVKSNDFFSKKIIKNKNLFVGEIEKFKLLFVIKNRTIVEISHDCENDKTLRKLLNIFFDICINNNIQEAADHAVIYLEEKIRITSNELIKPGIILPSHAGIYFDDLNYIIRKVFKEYTLKNTIDFGINKNYFKKSYHWINLSEQKKIEKIDLILKEIAQENNLVDQSIVVQSIDSNFKINLGVNKDFKDLQLKKNILLKIEIKLKRLDDTLEVFVDEVLDKNKLRLKNSPQTKLLN